MPSSTSTSQTGARAETWEARSTAITLPPASRSAEQRSVDRRGHGACTTRASVSTKKYSPHMTLSSTPSCLASWYDAVLEYALPGILVGHELRLAEPRDGDFGLVVVAPSLIIISSQRCEHDQSARGACRGRRLPATYRIGLVEVVRWHWISAGWCAPSSSRR